MAMGVGAEIDQRPDLGVQAAVSAAPSRNCSGRTMTVALAARLQARNLDPLAGPSRSRRPRPRRSGNSSRR
jgi:hypothetical protein